MLLINFYATDFNKLIIVFSIRCITLLCCLSILQFNFCQTTIFLLKTLLLQPYTQDRWAPYFLSRFQAFHGFVLTVNPSPKPNENFVGTSMFRRVDRFRIETQYWGWYKTENMNTTRWLLKKPPVIENQAIPQEMLQCVTSGNIWKIYLIRM